MLSDSFYKGPNQVHPEKESAVGSRNSLLRDGRNEYSESKLLIDEEVDKILNHVSSKLPPEVLEKLHVGGTVKEVLHNYFNQAFHNMYNRYLVTVEDELSKKFRAMVDREEVKGLNRFAPKQVMDLLDQLGTGEKFNSEDLEKSIVSIYSQLQQHLQKGVYDLRRKTNQILNEKSDVGSLVTTDHTYSIVKCQITDNPRKPESVTDVNMVINILESELLSPIFHFQATTESMIKEVISSQILQRVDEEIEDLKAKLTADGQGALSEEEVIFEKLHKLEQYVDFENTPNSPQYAFLAKGFMEKLEGIGAEIPKNDEYDPLNIRENLQRIVDDGKLRTRGFNKAVNAFTNFLDQSQSGYQHIENFKNARKVVIAEYADKDLAAVPDERYTVTLTYLDDEQIRAQRQAYTNMLNELQVEVERLWATFQKVHEQMRAKSGELNFQALSQIYSQGPPPEQSFMEKLMAKFLKKKKHKLPVAAEGVPVKLHDETNLITPGVQTTDSFNATFNEQKRFVRTKLRLLGDKINDAYQYETPAERLIMEERLEFLSNRFEDFSKHFNPNNVRPGLFVEISMSSIKKKMTTMHAMGEVLNNFLATVARGFVEISGNPAPTAPQQEFAEQGMEPIAEAS